MEANTHTDELFTVSGCLSERAVEAYVKRELPDHQRDELDKHIISCPLCRDAVEGYAISGSSVPDFSQLISKRINQEEKSAHHINRRMNRITTVLAMAASVILFVGIYLIIIDQVPEKQDLAQITESDSTNTDNIVVDTNSKITEPEQVVPEQKPTLTTNQELMKFAPSDVTESDAKNLLFADEVMVKDVAVESDRSAGIIENSNYQEDKYSKKEIVVADTITNARFYSPTPSASPSVGITGKAQEKKSKAATKSRAKTASMDSPKVASSLEMEEQPVFTIVEEMPSYPGGEAARLKFISENITYPQMARESGVQGTVFVTMVIDEKGKLTDIKVAKGIGSGCDEEAMRIVKKMPDWIPGKQAGKPVKIKYAMPIKFVLN